jgi:hypothetical protein
MVELAASIVRVLAFRFFEALEGANHFSKTAG